MFPQQNHPNQNQSQESNVPSKSAPYGGKHQQHQHHHQQQQPPQPVQQAIHINQPYHDIHPHFTGYDINCKQLSRAILDYDQIKKHLAFQWIFHNRILAYISYQRNNFASHSHFLSVIKHCFIPF